MSTSEKKYIAGFGLFMALLVSSTGAIAAAPVPNSASAETRLALPIQIVQVQIAPVQIAQVQIAQVQIAQAAPQRELVQRVQNLLVRLGFDPGPADGIIGDRTTRSVESFQEGAGLTVNGRVSEPLYIVLLGAVEKRARTQQPAASVQQTLQIAPNAGSGAGAGATRITAAPAVPVIVKFVDSDWTIFDSTGAQTKLKLLNDGKVSGVASPAFWRWQLRDGELVITYNNKLGGTVERRGRVSGKDELRGTGKSSRQREWTWIAKRAG